jgi:NAD(P)H-binding
MQPIDPSHGKADPFVLLTGGTGYIAGRLIPMLEKKRVALRCLARKPDTLKPCVAASSEVVEGDVLDLASIKRAMKGVHTAYYLIHLMSASKDFEKDDRQAAMNFAQAAKEAGVKRIIYLGGLGDDAEHQATATVTTALPGDLRRSSAVLRAHRELKNLPRAFPLELRLQMNLGSRLRAARPSGPAIWCHARPAQSKSGQRHVGICSGRRPATQIGMFATSE